VTYEDAYPETGMDELGNVLASFDAEAVLSFQVNFKSFKLVKFTSVRLSLPLIVLVVER
jgi:hypothetical protein